MSRTCVKTVSTIPEDLRTPRAGPVDFTGIDGGAIKLRPFEVSVAFVQSLAATRVVWFLRGIEIHFMRLTFSIALVFITMMAPYHLAQGFAQSSHSIKGERNMEHAVGSFEVKVVPSTHIAGEESSFGQMSFTKVISGEISGTSKGLMVTTSTPSTGAMAYAAVEIVTASLNARSGSFALIHNATMKKTEPGAESLHISVVPGSGTGDLAGITGTFIIHIDAKGSHTYEFNYQLP